MCPIIGVGSVTSLLYDCVFSRVFNGRISLSGTSEEHVYYLDAYVFLLGIVLPIFDCRFIFPCDLGGSSSYHPKEEKGEREGSNLR